MARESIADPRYPIVLVDKDEPLTGEELRGLLKEPGVTLLVRYAAGNEKRGGYYFQIGIVADGYVLIPLDAASESDHYKVVDFEFLLTLINHMSGRAFNRDALRYVRNVIDMPSD